MNLGGTEKALLGLLNEIDLKENEVTVLLLEKKGELLNRIPNEVKIKTVPEFEKMKPIIFNPPHYYAMSELKKKNIFNAIRTIIRYIKVKLTNSWYYNYIEALKEYPIKYEADIAVAFAGPSDFISYLILNNVKAKIKYQWIHFDVTKVISNKNFGNRFYHRFDKIFCVSQNSKNTFVKEFPQFESKTEIFENIVSETDLKCQSEFGESFHDDFDGLRILTLGRLAVEKGQQLVPNVVRRLKDDGLNFRWYLIGEGNLRKELAKEIKRLRIENELVLLGSKINPYSYLKDCDLYVQTSLHEGYCITLYEAKIFEKPVVTTDFLSASNLIENHGDGLIVEISENGIYAAVKELIKDDNKRKEFSSFLKKPESRNEQKVQKYFYLIK